MKRIFTPLISFLLFSWIAQAQPTTQATGITITPVEASTTSMRFDWTNGDGTNRIVILKTSASAYVPSNSTAAPSSTTTFPANNTGNDLDNGTGEIAACVFNSSTDGNGTTVTVGGLSGNKEYVIQVYEYTGSGGTTTYSFVTTGSNPIYLRYFLSSTNWTTPAGISSATVQAWGGGGAGGGNTTAANGGGGGGGGAYAKATVAVTGDIPVVVAQIKTGDNNGGAGGNNTTFGGTLVVAAGGSGGGDGSDTGTNGGGPGGTVAASTPNLSPPSFKGGNGGNGRDNSDGRGGGGGSSAGIAADGATGGNGGGGGAGGGGTAPLGGGGGGGGGLAGIDGNNGKFPGGGGGGSGESADGGDGAQGLLIVSYARPTVVITRNAVTTGSFSGTPDNSVSFDLAFSEVMDDGTFDFTDVSINVTGSVAHDAPAAGSLVNDGDDKNYTFTITGITGDGDISITVGPAIANVAGNEMASATTSAAFTIDNTGPGLTITRNAVTKGTVDGTTDDVVSFDLAFDGPIDDGTFTVDDILITATGVTHDAPVAGDLVNDGDDQNYTFTINNIDGDGTITITVGSDIADPATNVMAAAEGPSDAFTFDNTEPTLTITRNAVTLGSFTGTTDNSVSFDLAFSEDVNTSTFTIADIAIVTTGTISHDAPIAGNLVNDGDDQNFTFTINNIDGDGDIEIHVGPAIEDLAGNAMLAQEDSDPITFDNTPPGLTVTTNAVTLGSFAQTSDNSVSYDLAFDEVVNDGTFTIADIAVNVTGSVAFTAITGTDLVNDGDDQNYTLTISGITGDGTIDISVGPTILDPAGNPMAGAENASDIVTIDNSGPTVIITRNSVTLGTPDATADNTVSFDLAFNEVIDDATFDFNDVTVGTTGSVIFDAPDAGDLANDGDDQNYTFTITGVSGDGTIFITVGPSIDDPIGNSMAAAQGSPSFGIDNDPPGLVITRNAVTKGSFTGTTDNSVSFDLAFDEPITAGTFTTADITVSVTGSVNHDPVVVGDLVNDGDDQNFTFTINGITGDGDISITVGTGINDRAGNPMGGAVVSAAFTMENTAPTLVITRNPVTLGSFNQTTDNSVSFDLAFSEVINTGTFAFGDVTINTTGTVSFDAPGAGSIINDGDNQNFTFTISNITGDGTISVTVADVEDPAGNPITPEGPSDEFGIDNTAPTVVITRNPVTLGSFAGTTDNAVSFDLAFSEQVVNFTSSDVGTSVSGTVFFLTTSLTPDGDGKNFTYSIGNISGDGDIVISVGQNLNDLAGNMMAAVEGPSDAFTIDNIAPIIIVFSDANSAGTLKIGDQIKFTADVSITETGITITPLLYNGGALVWSTSDGGSTYTATYTVEEGQSDRTSALQLTGVVATDAAGNASSPASTVNVFKTIDANSPAAFTTGTLTPTGGTVVAGFWNATNTGLNVAVPIPANVGGEFSLEGGIIQLQARVGSDAFVNLGGTFSINPGEPGTTKTVSISAATFESIANFADGKTAQIRAVITDPAGNSTTGTESATDIFIDQTPPTTQTVGSLTTTGGRVVAGYWNSHNTGLDVVVPLENSDATLDNGTVRIQVQNTQTLTWVNVTGTGQSTISSGQRSGGSKTVSITAADLEAASSFVEGVAGGASTSETRFVQVRARVTDVAGNSTFWNKSTTDIDVDQTPPGITGPINLYTDAGLGSGDGNHEVIQLELNEDITLADATNVLSTNTDGNPGFYVGGVLETAESMYESDGQPNVDVAYNGKRAIYLESNTNSSGWTVGVTSVVYTRQSTFPGSGNFVKDAAGNEMGAFSNVITGTGTTTTIGAAAVGVAANPLVAGTTNQAVLGFSLTSSISLDLTSVTIATTADPNTLLKNFRLFASVGSDNFGSASNLSLPATVAAGSVSFNAITTVSLSSTPTYFYLVADIEPYFFSAAPQIQFSLATTGITVSTGSRTGSRTGTNYTLDDNTPPTFTVTNAVDPIYLGALTQTITFLFNEPMNNTTDAAPGKIAVQNGITTNWGNHAGGTWSTTNLTNDTYTVTITHNGAPETYNAVSGMFNNAGITDWGGNPNPGQGAATTFVVDTQRPTVAQMTPDISAVTIDNNKVRISVRYSETMNTAVAPTVTISDGTFDAGTPVSGVGYTNGWKTGVATNDTYEIDFVNNTTNEEFAGVTASATGAIDFNGNQQNVAGTSSAFTIDTKRPTVVSISRASGTPTNATSVTYVVKFSEKVTNVGTNDFSPKLVSTASGTPSAGFVSGVSNPSADGITYNVTVSGVVGDGDIRLDVDGTTATITDQFGNALNTGRTGDEIYTIDQTVPLVTSIAVTTPPTPNAWSTTNGTSASDVNFLVTFSEDVFNVDAADFAVGVSGTVNASITNVVVNGDKATVTVHINSGNGRVRIDFLDNNSVTDLAGNPQGGAGTQNVLTAFTTVSQYYSIVLPQPSNPVANFTVSSLNEYDLFLKIDHAIGGQEPTHYLIMVRESLGSTAFPNVTDGQFIANDPNDGTAGHFDGDGLFIQNVVKSGATSQAVEFWPLKTGMDYDFIVYPYTLGNYSNDNIDYGTPTSILNYFNPPSSTSTLSSTPVSKTVSSTVISSPGDNVFTFTVTDEWGVTGGEISPTKFTGLTIRELVGVDQVTDWSAIIVGAELYDISSPTTFVSASSITANEIVFTNIPSKNIGDLGFVPAREGYLVGNPSFKNYGLRIFFDNTLGALTGHDNLALAFRVTDTDFVLDDGAGTPTDHQESSRFVPGAAAQSGSNTIDIRATKLVFVTNPQNQIGVATPFGSSSQAQPEVHALDPADNLDTDYAASFNVITTTGFTPVHTNFTSGILVLSNSYFTTAGTSTITIQGNATGSPFSYPALSGPGVEAVSTAVTSVISNQTTISEATVPASELASFPSITNASPAFYNFDFTITDDVGVDAVDFIDNDGLPTLIQNITINQGSDNGDNGGGSDASTFDDWTLSIGGAELIRLGFPDVVSGTVGANSISFAIPAGSSLQNVADDDLNTYRLRIWLKNPVDLALRDILDNKDFVFTINENDIDIGAANTTSELTASSASTADGRNVVTVTATQLDFVTQPPTDQSYDADLTQTPVLKARDANGNLDLDYNSDAVLSPVFVPTPPDNTVAHAYPLTTTDFTFANGILSLDNVAVSSSGNGVHNDVIQLSVVEDPDQPSVSPGLSDPITLKFSGTSDIIRDPAFVKATNIVTISNREKANLTAANSIALDRFVLRDGGASNDTDGTSTKLQAITFNVSNFQNIARIGIYDESGVEIQELDSTAFSPTGDITFNAFVNVFEADDDDRTSKLLYVRASFRNDVTDNQQMNVSVLSAFTEGVSSQLISINIPPDNLGTDKNKVEVVATQIDFTTVPASASINVSFAVVAEARDMFGNLDEDYNGAISFTNNGNTAGYDVANLPTGAFVGGILTYPADDVLTPAVDEGFQFTSGDNVTQLTINGGAASTAESVDAAAITGTSTNIIVTTSQDSWVYFDPSFPYTTRIDFVNKQETTLTATSQALALVVLSDGGAPGSAVSASNPTPGVKNLPIGQHSDIDGASTKISELTISITNSGDIRKIALFDFSGNMITGTEQDAAPTVTFTGLEAFPALIAADNDVAKFYIRASFNETVGSDLDQITIQIMDVVWQSGSQFPPTDGTSTVGGVDGIDAGGDSTDPTQNMVDVIATSLDFVVQASTYAGIDEPIGPSYTTAPQPSTSAAVVHARDKFENLDLDFDVPASNITVTGGGAVSTKDFIDGVLDLDGMIYTIPGDGTLAIEANGLNSSTPGPENIGNSIPGETVNVVHVTAKKVINGVLSTPNIKGGTPNSVIFGVAFYPTFNTNSQPSLKRFTFSFDNPYATATETILKGFKVFQDVDSTFAGSIQVDPSQVTTASSTGDSNLDQVVVDLSNNPVPLFNAINGQSAFKTFYLVADVDVTANINSSQLTPQLIDSGYNHVTDDHIVLTRGTAFASVVGQKYQFATTRPPVLLSQECEPFNGQLNVDANLQQIKLKFDVQVWSLDGAAELFDRATNEKVADLVAVDGNFQTNGAQTPTANPLTFDIVFLPGYSFEADKVYYVTVKKGALDNINNIQAGISDNGFNFFGGISSNATMYFKISSENAPVLSDAKAYFSNLISASFSTKFDQRGTAFYLVLDHTAYVNNGSVAPSNADILSPAAYALANPGSVLKSGSYMINRVNEHQTISFGADMTASTTYDVWIYAQNDANPTPIVTTAPYGAGPTFAVGGAGPTMSFTVPPVSNLQTSHQPTYLLCPDSYITVTEPIIIGEVNTSDFQGAGVQDFNLLLPTGYQFDVSSLPNVELNGDDFDQASLSVNFINNTLINISYKNTSATDLDNIIISDFRLFGVEGTNPGSIKRFSGNASLGGIVDLAALTVVPPANQVFTNSYSIDNDFTPFGFLPSDIITAIPDNYIDQDGSISGGVRLIPLITPANDYGASLFSGNGVTNDVLRLSAVALNSAFDVTMIHADVNGCVSEDAVQYVVYDHRSPISQKLGSAQGGTQQALYNLNFPQKADTVIFPNAGLERINYPDLAGYNLINLYCDIPTSVQSVNDQIIFGPAWQAQVSEIPVPVDSVATSLIPTAVKGSGFYRSFQWDYNRILNAVSESNGAITTNPYDNFRLPTPNGATYWTGGFLGNVEFTGVFQSTADLTVIVPFRQQVALFVPPIPVVEVDDSNQPEPGVTIYCESGGPITINGYPAAAAGSSVGVFRIYDKDTNIEIQPSAPNSAFVDNGNGTATLYPMLLDNNNNNIGITNGYKEILITYTYRENISPALGVGSIVIQITPNPVADFTVSPYTCAGTEIDFQATPSIAAPFNAAADITRFEWTFDDSNENESDAPAPSHTYQVPDIYSVSLTVTSDFGCSSPPETKPVTVGAVPEVKFTFTGTSVNDGIQFTSQSNVAGPNPGIAEEEYIFFDSEDDMLGPGEDPSDAPGVYRVKLVVTSNVGCIDSLSQRIVVVPNETATDALPFEETFADGDGGWQVWNLDKTNPPVPTSWGFGKPTGQVITGPDDAWTTTNVNNEGGANPRFSYYGREHSALYTPVFDIGGLARPMISFNSFVQLENSDGVVLQYSTDDLNIADENKVWKTLGSVANGVSTGVDWYNGVNLASQPGNQNVNIYGWTQTPDPDNDGTFEWLESKHSLDDIPVNERGHVAFRFALASANASPGLEGFAVDNLRIGNRTRIVLVENFTNLGNSANHPNGGGNVETVENTSIKTFVDNGASGSVVVINYHVGFPKKDPFNLDNTQDPAARALYYNISKTPRVRMDGAPPDDPDALFSEWGVTAYNRRSLKLADAQISVTPGIVDGMMQVTVNVTALRDLNENTILNIALLEKSIATATLSDPMKALIADGGVSEVNYVLKKLVPSPTGTRFGAPLANGEQRSFGPFPLDDHLRLYTPDDDLALVVFLQNELQDGNGEREVYQTEIINLSDPPVITGLGENLNRFFYAYPNPADKEMIVELPIRVTRASTLRLYDAMGHTVHQSVFDIGESTRSIDTSEMAAGVYLIQVETEKGILTRKVMIVHRN